MDSCKLGCTIPTELGLLTNLRKCIILVDRMLVLAPLSLCAYFVMKYLDGIQSHLRLDLDLDFHTISLFSETITSF